MEETENSDTLTYTSKSAISDKEADRKQRAEGEKEGGTLQKSSRSVRNDRAKTNELFVRL